MMRTSSKYMNDAFEGKIRRGGDLELQRRNMDGTNSAISTSILVARVVFIGPQFVYNLLAHDSYTPNGAAVAT